MTTVSVLIPTHARSAKLAACLERLARQSVDADVFEALVGIDGHDDIAQHAAADAWIGAGGRPDRLLIRQCVKSGPNAVRNALLETASGRLSLFLNDDVLPAPDLVETHLRAHENRRSPALILGAAPWLVHQPDRIFDRLVRDTSMIFFYDRMNSDDPEHDWGFRHAWTLNLSARTDLVRACAGFPVVPSVYGYDDLAFAWAFCRAAAAPVLFRPEAVVHHDHRLEPRDYLDRERHLGASAWRYAQALPEFAHDVFRRDVTTDAELDAARAALAEIEAELPELERWFLSLADQPADSVPDDEIGALYERHLPLKRAMWRRGLVAEAQARHPRPRQGTAGAPRSHAM